MRGIITEIHNLSLGNIFKSFTFHIGLDDTLVPYIHFMLKQEINGHRLLSTTVEDLPVFRIDKLGHQEIFMGAVDLLRDFVRILHTDQQNRFKKMSNINKNIFVNNSIIILIGRISNFWQCN